MLARITCLFAAPLLLAGQGQDEKKTPAELQGGWRLQSVKVDDGDLPLPEARPALVIKGDRVLYGGEELGRLVVDASASPKVIDVRMAGPERVYEGIYELKKDKLTICLNGRADGPKERPDAFAVEGKPAWRLFAFERIKPEDAGPGTGFVGVALRYNADSTEVVIADTLKDSPAKKADLRKDDVLLAVGGEKIGDLRSAVDAVRKAKPRSELTLRVRRGEEERDVKVKVGLLPFHTLVGLD